MSDWKFEDSRMPTEQERRKLCEMLFQALLEIRILGRAGKAQQAADLADAFHNLPVFLWSDAFSLSFFRKFLESYRQKYPEAGFNYVETLDKLIQEESE